MSNSCIYFRHRLTSSRKLAAGCENEVALRYLTANQQPDFRTISDFRKDHLAELDGLFVEVLGLCKEAGLVKLGRVALDGRKIAGNASLDQNRDEEWLQEEVGKLLAEGERVDAEEDARYGKEERGDELPKGLRTSEERRERLEAALGRIEEKKRQAVVKQERKIEERRREEEEKGNKKRGRKPKGAETAAMEVAKGTKANVTDPESRIMKTRRGWVQGFNGQAATDCESQVIVAQDLTQEENDVKQLEPLLEKCAGSGTTGRGVSGGGVLERGEREAGERGDGAIHCHDERLETAPGDARGTTATGTDS